MHDQSTKHPKADVAAIVTQNKDTWDFEDVANGVEETTNKISATNLTAGNWKGTFNFNINLKGLEVYGEDVTLTKDNLATYGISTTGDVTIPSIVIDSDGTKHKVTKIGTNGKHNPSSIFSDINSITSLTIEEGIKEINEICLKSLTSVSLPNNLETIGNYTFISSQLKNITLPDNIKTIGDSAFQNCNLISSITYKGTTYTNKNNLINALKTNNVTFSDTLFDDTLLNYGKNVTLSSDNLATYGIANTGYVTIPSVVTDSDGTKHKVTSIGNMAFYGCSGLKSITIKSGVTSIGFRAFYNCSGVTSITIPDSVIDISDMAFYGCSGLTSITMPNGVKNIASSAFQNCSNLTSITYHGTTYTNKTELTNALTSNGVNVGTNVFDGTKLQ